MVNVSTTFGRLGDISFTGQPSVRPDNSSLTHFSLFDVRTRPVPFRRYHKANTTGTYRYVARRSGSFLPRARFVSYFVPAKVYEPSSRTYPRAYFGANTTLYENKRGPWTFRYSRPECRLPATPTIIILPPDHTPPHAHVSSHRRPSYTLSFVSEVFIFQTRNTVWTPSTILGQVSKRTPKSTLVIRSVSERRKIL